MQDQTHVHHLRAKGFRLTPQRLAILRILEQTGGHLSALEVYQRAAELLPGITETTVYRSLAFLSEQGLVMPTHTGSGQLVYEYGAPAHHHLVCRACGHTQAIEHDALSGLYEELAARTGYEIDSLHVTFMGYCPGCQHTELKT